MSHLPTSSVTTIPVQQVADLAVSWFGSETTGRYGLVALACSEMRLGKPSCEV